MRDERIATVLLTLGIVLSMVLTFGPDYTPEVEVVQVKDPTWTLVESVSGSSAVPVAKPAPAKVGGGGIMVGVPVPEAWKGLALPADGVPRLDVCFCLDTTGSMRDEIALAKERILEIARAVAAGTPTPVVEYALVIYRDLGDEYVVRVHDFMSADDLAIVLSRVVARAGGDYRESVAEAVHRSVHELSWDERSCRAIYLIGDAPPHTDYDNGFDYKRAAEDAAERGIVINAIGCSGISRGEREFREMAETTGGVFVYLQPCDREKGWSFAKFLGTSDSDDAPDEIPIIEYTWDDYVSASCEEDMDGTPADFDVDHDALDETRSLDGVLTSLIQVQAMHVGVSYEDA